MAPKGKGGLANTTAIDYVVSLRRRGFDDMAIRQQLKADGYRGPRICQLMRALAERERPDQLQARAGSSRDDALMESSVQELEGGYNKTSITHNIQI